jgi:hypothetical protein
MSTVGQALDEWLSATTDFLLALLGFAIIWYPAVSVGNAIFGSPVSTATTRLIVGVLAFGGAYPVVAGDWSLGRLGEFVFVLTASALGWGAVGMVGLLISGTTLSGRSALPQAVVWIVAYLTAYVVVYRSPKSVVR